MNSSSANWRVLAASMCTFCFLSTSMSFICFLNAAVSSVFCLSSRFTSCRKRSFSPFRPVAAPLCPSRACSSWCLYLSTSSSARFSLTSFALASWSAALFDRLSRSISFLVSASSRSLASAAALASFDVRFSLSSAVCICFTCLPMLSFSVSRVLSSPSRSFSRECASRSSLACAWSSSCSARILARASLPALSSSGFAKDAAFGASRPNSSSGAESREARTRSTLLRTDVGLEDLADLVAGAWRTNLGGSGSFSSGHSSWSGGGGYSSDS